MNRQALIDLLTTVRPGLSSKEVVELSTAFLFRKGRVITFNDEVYVSAPLPDELTEALDGIAVEAKPFYNLLLSTNSKDVKLKVLKNELRVTGKGFKAGVRLYKSERPLDIELPTRYKKFNTAILHALDICQLTASKDMSRPLITCVHVHPEFVEATDSYRLTTFPMETGVKKPFLIPARHIPNLLAYDVLSYARQDGWLHFRNKNKVIFSCRTFEETYVDTTPAREKKGTRIQFTKKLIEILEAANVFLNDKHASEMYVEIKITDNKAKVRSEGSDGWFAGRVPARCAKDVSFYINPFLLRDVLQSKGRIMLGKRSIIFKTSEFIHQVVYVHEMPHKEDEESADTAAYDNPDEDLGPAFPSEALDADMDDNSF